MHDDAVYIYCPRWLEESGLPAELNNKFGPGAWPVFKKLAELEAEQNLLPDWFSTHLEELSDWTGVSRDEANRLIDELSKTGYFQRRKVSGRTDEVRLKFPRSLPVPRKKEEIDERLKARGFRTARMHWRHLSPPRLRDEERKVLYLYEQLFGLQMNDRIAAMLVEIARTFEYSDIEEAFAEAKKKGAKTLKWIQCRLFEGVKNEELPETGRRRRSQKGSRRPSDHR
jgi:hypothetical protein